MSAPPERHARVLARLLTELLPGESRPAFYVARGAREGGAKLDHAEKTVRGPAA